LRIALRIDTRVLASIGTAFAIIGWVLTYKGYLPWEVEVPLAWGSFALYMTPRVVFEFERNK
jgi:hypothetical protein